MLATPSRGTGRVNQRAPGADGSRLDLRHRRVSTIQTAVNAAVDGVDVIRVAPGTFAELVTVNKTLDVFGNQTGVDARNRAAVPETIVNGNAGTTAFIVDDDDVELNGFTVRDQTQVNQFGAGVFLRPGTAGTEFRNNIVEFNVIGLFLANDDGGNQTVIERNVFRQNNNPGVLAAATASISTSSRPAARSTTS